MRAIGRAGEVHHLAGMDHPVLVGIVCLAGVGGNRVLVQRLNEQHRAVALGNAFRVVARLAEHARHSAFHRGEFLGGGKLRDQIALFDPLAHAHRHFLHDAAIGREHR